MVSTTKNKRVLFSELLKGFDEVAESAVTQEELKDVLNTVADFIKKLESRVSENTAKNKADMEAGIVRVRKDFDDFEERCMSMMRDLDTKQATSLNKSIAQLSEKVNEVEEMIAYYDDAEVRQMIVEVGKKIPVVPPQFDATELTESVADHEKRIDELEKRPLTGKSGGGITDRGLQYAMSRVVQQVTPSGTIDGANATFTVNSTIHAILSFELNSRVVSLGEYTITGGKRMTIVFDTAPPAAYSGKSFVVTYL